MAFTRWLRRLHFAWLRCSKARNRRPAACSLTAARYRPRLELLEDRLCLSALPPAPALSPADAATQSRVSQAYGQLPLSFEANQGQSDAGVDFLAHGSGYTLLLAPGEAVLALHKPDPAPGTDASPTGGDVLRMELVGGNAQSPATGLEPQAGTSNYFIGNDSTQWHTGIANFGRVEYQGVYAGVNLTYYGNQRQLEYDFIIAPGANPGVITLAFQGTHGMTLDPGGNLVLHTAGGDVVEHAPILYQDVSGIRETVTGDYVLQGGNRLGFAVGTYDRSQALVIDPVLSYSTYLGGSGADYGQGIAVDSAGNAYVTGYSSSWNFPTSKPAQAGYGGNTDAFVAKLNAGGTALVYSTYLGGRGGDLGYGIAVDGAGDAYVTGYTTSTNFPTKNPLQAAKGSGSATNAFVAELNSTGTALVYSTYLGGSIDDRGYGIAVDGAGDAYVTGETSSTNFPTKNPLQAANGGSGSDAFVAKLNAGGTALVYSTYLGGSSNDSGQAIAVDGAGDAYVTGDTDSVNFPTRNPLQAAYGNDQDAFVAELNAAGTGLVYSTYLGGSGTEYGYGIAVDSAGDAYVTGGTNSSNFPTKNPLQAALGSNGVYDAFVAELNPTGTALVYSTYLGGRGYDKAYGIAVDSLGNAYVTGVTSSTNFPTKNPIQATKGGTYTAFVTEVNAGGTALVYSSYLGGSLDDRGYGIAVDGAGNAYVTGETSSTNFPTKNPLQVHDRGGFDAFVTKISVPAAAASGLLLSVPSTASAGSPFNGAVLTTDASGNLATGYSGTIQRTSFNMLPGSYPSTQADHGASVVSLTPTVAGAQPLTAFGNHVTGYSSNPHLTDAVGSATPALGYTFPASDRGVHPFTGPAPRTRGNHPLTVGDTKNRAVFGSAIEDVL